jgi:sugar/nucleoside kinase (ribokinase family)
VSEFDYVTVGHVTVDVVGGIRRPGGGAFYSALQAARLGMRTQIVTQGQTRELQALLEPYRGEMQLRILPARHTTTLATAGMGSERRQRVLAWAGAMAEPIEVDTAILHMAAVARETPSHWQGRADFVGVTPQGLMRRWSESGEMTLAPLALADMPGHADAVVVNERERPFFAAIEGARERTGTIAVTAGGAPTTVLLSDGAMTQVAAPTVEHPHEDLGAGDVFAAAFFVALYEGRSPVEAAAYGNAAAALRIAGIGAEAIGAAAAIARAQHR